MAIVNSPPFDLPIGLANQEIATILFDVRQTETLTPSDAYIRILNATNYGTVGYGKGIINTVKTKYQDIETRSKTSTAFQLREPVTRQEAILVDTYEFCAISLTSTWTNESFINGNSVSNYLSFLARLVPDSLTVDMFENKIEPLFRHVWLNNTVLPWNTDTPTTMADRNAQLEYNARMIAQAIKNRSNLYYRRRTDLTDVEDLTTQLKRGDLYLYVDSTLMVYIKIALAGVFNPDNILQTFGVADIIEIPSQTGELPTTLPVAWLCHRNKVSHITGYTTGGSMYDASTDYTTHFQHRATGFGLFTTLAGESMTLAPADAGTRRLKGKAKTKKLKIEDLPIGDPEKEGLEG